MCRESRYVAIERVACGHRSRHIQEEQEPAYFWLVPRAGDGSRTRDLLLGNEFYRIAKGACRLLNLRRECDVLQADEGTRTASITGAYVALAIVLGKLIRDNAASPRALRSAVAAVSVGIIGGEARLDLNYAEDSRAEVDFNVVMTAAGEFVEVQGTGEAATFSRAQMDELLNLAKKGVEELLGFQRQALKDVLS